MAIGGGNDTIDKNSGIGGGAFAKGSVSHAEAGDGGRQGLGKHGNVSDSEEDDEYSGVPSAPKTLRDRPAKSDRAIKTSRDKRNIKKEDKGAEKEKELDEIDKRVLKSSKKYQRGLKMGKDKEAAINVRSKKEESKVAHDRRRREEAIMDAARNEMLLAESAGYIETEGLERTFNISQKQLAENLDVSSANKIIDLKLNDFGPYTLDYTPNGRHMLIGGRKGHLATMDWRSGKLACEIHVRELVRDVSWLHNESLFAVAQKKHAYIYDHTGAEVHCLSKHMEPTKLGFLPYHFLLASTGMTGALVYQDVTEGKVAGEHHPGYGQCSVLKVNPYNAVVHLGHGNGTVTLWSPKQTQPLARILCHKGPVQAMAIDRSGTYMATSGLDGRLKIWDIRNFKPLHEYATTRPAQSIDISQRGLLAAGHGPNVTVWKDALTTQVYQPYMRHLVPSATVSDLHFVPYDDVLGFGHSKGISSIVIPGAGEPNFDAYVANPYQTKKQRQEHEVKMLLDKLAPETIQLDPNFIGRLDPRTQAQRLREQVEDKHTEYAENKADGRYLDNEVKNKTKGRNSTAKRYARKRQTNITDLKKLRELENMERELQQQEAKRRKIPEEEKGALGKFFKEKRLLER
ncbi:putative U3 small nucleolar RNA-associated protein 7 [Coemansia sp. RSA 1813]|nr:putative U3 small nucleolar RNA-associated protein 7 [Coemansia sp. RSA 1646]KAJ1766467.1 putative U3 small nucleolar RNA-associated protein 7 [Coemansia sp. RSA 1843]KAJ2213692.1 putative U3 small nucleolar RNA-associated protein 7 [Coemansia sp. RSA 487]KAJ2568705.1 putative U3 small nucleolar RNA-associated protein 7 [Coemansia sp. RSA 1813]